jgi:hypothetical protein
MHGKSEPSPALHRSHHSLHAFPAPYTSLLPPPPPPSTIPTTTHRPIAPPHRSCTASTAPTTTQAPTRLLWVSSTRTHLTARLGASVRSGASSSNSNPNPNSDANPNPNSNPNPNPEHKVWRFELLVALCKHLFKTHSEDVVLVFECVAAIYVIFMVPASQPFTTPYPYVPPYTHPDTPLPKPFTHPYIVSKFLPPPPHTHPHTPLLPLTAYPHTQTAPLIYTQVPFQLAWHATDMLNNAAFWRFNYSIDFLQAL